MSTTGQAIRLGEVVAQLNEDEMEVVLAVAERLAGVGRESYGPLDLATDTRDWAQEAWMETLDQSVYLALVLRRLTKARAV